MWHVRQTSPRWCHCCLMNAVAKPGQCVGSGMPDCCVHECVFKEGGVTWAAAVATWARVLMRRVGLVGVTALQCCVDCRLWMHSCLDELAGKVLGLMPGARATLSLGLLVVATRGALIGLLVGLLAGTLGTGDYGCMECVICLLLLLWGLGMLGGACTLGTWCMLRILSGIMVSSNLLGCACMWVCVESMICCRSCAAWEVLALSVIPWMALKQSANACITLSMCVMQWLVIGMCWNWTVLDSCLLLVCLIWQSYAW